MSINRLSNKYGIIKLNHTGKRTTHTHVHARPRASPTSLPRRLSACSP